MAIKKWVLRSVIKVAESSTYDVFRHGAVIEKGGSIIASGVNSSKATAPKVNVYSTHAEVDAINAAGDDNCIGASLYVARVARGKNKIANSKPCKRCMAYIMTKGIKRIIYSISDNEWAVDFLTGEINTCDPRPNKQN